MNIRTIPEANHEHKIQMIHKIRLCALLIMTSIVYEMDLNLINNIESFQSLLHC